MMAATIAAAPEHITTIVVLSKLSSVIARIHRIDPPILYLTLCRSMLPKGLTSTPFGYAQVSHDQKHNDRTIHRGHIRYRVR
jgi:hypothetical protein